MNNIITTFAALQSYYSSGNDLLGIISYLILQVLPSENKKVSVCTIKNLLTSEYKLDIPHDVIQTVLKRLNRKEQITYNNIKDINLLNITITKAGENDKEKIKQDFRKADREKNALLSSLQSSLSNEYNKHEVEKGFDTFIKRNFYYLTRILDGEEEKEHIPAGLQSAIANFFIKAEKSDPINFEILKSILFGKIIASALLRQNNFNREAKFDPLEVYLDTNIIFSLMGLHDEMENESAFELIEIIRKSGFSLKIFSFTKDEVVAKLRGYLNNQNNYSTEIGVDSIYYVLKKKNYTTLDVMRLIENIEDVLKKLEISINYTFEKKKLLQDEDQAFAKLESFSPSKPRISLEHDFAAIAAIKRLRRNRTYYLLEKSAFVFLTADSQLAKYNYSNDHKINTTIPEVIYRNEFASIFWLKNWEGSESAFIHNLLANFAQTALIAHSLWDKFIATLKQEKEKGNKTDDDINFLISHEDTEKILRERGEEGIKLIIDDNVIKIRKQQDAEKEEKILKDSEVINEQADKLINISKAIEVSCMKRWNQIINCSLWIMLGIYIAAITFIIFFSGLHLSYIFFILPFLMIIELRFKISIIPRHLRNYLPDSWDLPEIRNRFENIRVEKCVQRKKKELNFSDF